METRGMHRVRVLRRLVLPMLRKLDLGDITIRHHWTRDALSLHSFRHKGYWYHGRRRECSTMEVFPELLRSGDFVVEIGAHIGYVSLYLAHLIGSKGRLVVFEPGPNNLPYLRQNTKSYPNIAIVEKAVTDHTGSAKFFVENLTGQNNSLLDHYSVLQDNERWAFIKSVDEEVVEVECTTLDDFLTEGAPAVPSFIKIDVEGSELCVLKGMEDTLRRRDVALMVEVTENATDVFRLLHDAEFHLFLPDKSQLNDPRDVKGNVFCLKADDQRISVFFAKGMRVGLGPLGRFSNDSIPRAL